MSDESDDGSARRKSGGNYRERITTPEAVLFQDFQIPWNFYFLLMCDDQTISDWMIANGLLVASIPCDKPRCQGELFRKKRGDRQGGFTLRCNENRNHERPMRYNSCFEKSKLCVQDLMVFIKTYLDGNTLLQASRFAGVAYGTTAVNWGSYIRELFKEYFERHTKEVKMRGEVEIDESLFGRRCKYHKGNPNKGLKVWIVGLVERTTGRIVLYPVADRIGTDAPPYHKKARTAGINDLQ